MNIETYFKRQIELWGDEAQESLREKRILIIGCGGLGSSLAMALGTSGIAEIYLVDFDEVSLHNIHRQIAFTLKDEGKNKAQVCAKLILNKNPFVKVVSYECDFDTFITNIEESFDLILDATDNLAVRKRIDIWSKEQKTPWIYASVEAFNGQVCLFDRANFGVFAINEHTPSGISAPMVMQIASFQANIALRYLVGLPVIKDCLYYLYYDRDGEFIIKKFTLPNS